MKIKKFTADSMKEALLLVKSELGDDAMILKTRKIPGSILPGKRGEQIEVTAAIDEDKSVAPGNMPNISVPKSLNTGYTSRLRHVDSAGEDVSKTPVVEKRVAPPLKQSVQEPSQAESRIPSRSGPDSSVQIMKIHDELSEMKKLLASVLATGETNASGGFAGPWAILYRRLVDSEIREEFAKDLLNKLKEGSPNPGKEINRTFIDTLASSFPTVHEDLQERVHCFVGPTGAGKTTTIAKLAAYFSLEKKKKVSLITADTYRIAAVEQLRTYAEIVGIDLQVVFRPDEVMETIQACADSDIILVDTAGRSQMNREHLEELSAFLAELKPDAKHLVLSAGTKESDLRDIVQRYKRFGINRLIFTKLDETISLGNVYNTVNESMLPVSYFTFGQNVPDDIERAQAAVFVKKVLERSSI